MTAFLSSTLRFSALTLLLGASLALGGCSGEDGAPAWMAGGASGSMDFEEASGPCELGTDAVCTETIEQANGVTSCYRGMKYCVDGEWSACLDPDAPAPL